MRRTPLPVPPGATADAGTVFTRVFAAHHADVYWLDGGPDTPSYLGSGTPVPLRSGRVLEDLAAAQSALRTADDPGADLDTDASFRLGLVGWLDYELRHETVAPHPGTARSRPSSGPAWPPSPAAAFLRTDRAVAVHPDGRIELLTADDVDHDAFAQEVLDRLATPVPAATAPVVLDVTRADDDETYLANIRAAQDAIIKGLAYVLCLTTEYRVRGLIDPVGVYLALRRRSPTHHGGFLRIGGVALVSASPERFLEVTPAGLVTTRPIKGTRPRGATPEEDRRLAAELAADEKERAENVMIVDLMRNDLQRVCRVGSVTVPALWAVESYAQVHQLVSTVQGRLLPGRTAVDAIRSCFPAGSMTGAPKQAATDLLSALEQRDRGRYAGAFGHLGPDGRADLAMTIRSIVVEGDTATIGVGGGITALSDPQRELEEMELKAGALLEAVGASAVRVGVRPGGAGGHGGSDADAGVRRLRVVEG
ncbi:anthranilate synthase component I family protein [Tersicoccus sp. MR15.9]|uniref:anthranilate synthase component I family protein n=1 Tax=Tersicoccus mangrovi TaxID=3121635 RepID=UPI002FE5B344